MIASTLLPPLQHFDPLLFALSVLVLLSDAEMTTVVATEDRDADGDWQLLELQETLEPTLILGILVPQVQMLGLVRGLGTSGGGSAAPVDLCLLRFRGMVLLVSSLFPMCCLQMNELTATYLSAPLVVLLSHLG